MKYLPYFSLIFMVLFVTFSCDKKEEVQLDMGYDFYPLEIGHYVTYQVDSFFYSDAAYPLIRIDTISYQFKEVIDTVYKDNENRDAYRIVTYRRADATAAWQVNRVWSAVRNVSSLVKNEDDLHFIKLIFPVNDNSTWSGNNLIVTDAENAYLNGWTYSYSNVNGSQLLNGVNYDSCVTVNQLDEENLIEKNYSVEQYAKQVGLIYKEQKFLGKQRNLTNGWDFPESGIWVRQIIIDHN
ncbi:MAG: hypothetical protein WCP57_05280 [Bacteroidota bacterium]